MHKGKLTAARRAGGPADQKNSPQTRQHPAKRHCASGGLPRRHRPRGAAAPRQARHDAPAIGASLGDLRALSGADRERRRQSVGQRAARHRAGARPSRCRAAAGSGRAHRRARRHPRSAGAGAGERTAGARQGDRGARGASRRRRPRPAHRAGRPARRRQVDARADAGRSISAGRSSNSTGGSKKITAPAFPI